MFPLSLSVFGPPHGLQDVSSPNQGLNLGLEKCWVLTSGCSYSVTQLCLTLCNPMGCNLTIPQAFLSLSGSLPKVMFIASVMPPSHLILWCPLLLLPSIFPSIRDFSNESSIHIQWPKYWSFRFSISLSSEYSGLIFHKIDWFHLLAVQETFRNLLQHHSSKASILWCSAFFMVQLSPYMTTGKTIALTIWTFVSSVSAFQHTV